MVVSKGGILGKFKDWTGSIRNILLSGNLQTNEVTMSIYTNSYMQIYSDIYKYMEIVT